MLPTYANRAPRVAMICNFSPMYVGYVEGLVHCCAAAHWIAHVMISNLISATVDGVQDPKTKPQNQQTDLNFHTVPPSFQALHPPFPTFFSNLLFALTAIEALSHATYHTIKYAGVTRRPSPSNPPTSPRCTASYLPPHSSCTRGLALSIPPRQAEQTGTHEVPLTAPIMSHNL